MTPRRIAIIANGDTPCHPEVLAALAACDACVCCDRLPPEGAPKLLQVVGDLDTLVESLPPECVTDLSDDQETNDLTKGATWARTHYPEAHLDYFAITGKREDHTLANLALVAAMAHPAVVYTESGRFDVLMAGEHTLAVVKDAPISFLSFVPQRLTAYGVVWPVESLSLDTLWRATLNRTAASQVKVRCEAPLLVYRPWEK